MARFFKSEEPQAEIEKIIEAPTDNRNCILMVFTSRIQLFCSLIK